MLKWKIYYLAGGVGALNNADYLASIIYPVLPNVHYRGTSKYVYVYKFIYSDYF